MGLWLTLRACTARLVHTRHLAAMLTGPACTTLLAARAHALQSGARVWHNSFEGLVTDTRPTFGLNPVCGGMLCDEMVRGVRAVSFPPACGVAPNGRGRACGAA